MKKISGTSYIERLRGFKGKTYAELSNDTALSMPTVQRICKEGDGTFSNVESIINALGYEVIVEVSKDE